MALDPLKRLGQDDGLADELAPKRRVEAEVERELAEAVGRHLEGEDLALIGEREDDAVRDGRDVRSGGHDELEGRPGLKMKRVFGGRVELDGGGRGGGRGAREGVAEGELDEASLVEAGSKAIRIRQCWMTVGSGDLTSCARRSAAVRWAVGATDSG